MGLGMIIAKVHMGNVIFSAFNNQGTQVPMRGNRISLGIQ